MGRGPGSCSWHSSEQPAQLPAATTCCSPPRPRPSPTLYPRPQGGRYGLDRRLSPLALPLRELQRHGDEGPRQCRSSPHPLTGLHLSERPRGGQPPWHHVPRPRWQRRRRPCQLLSRGGGRGGGGGGGRKANAYAKLRHEKKKAKQGHGMRCRRRSAATPAVAPVPPHERGAQRDAYSQPPAEPPPQAGAIQFEAHHKNTTPSTPSPTRAPYTQPNIPTGSSCGNASRNERHTSTSTAAQ